MFETIFLWIVAIFTSAFNELFSYLNRMEISENTFFWIISGVIVGLIEITLHPVFVRFGWKDEMSLSKRVMIAWPIGTFLLYSFLVLVYLMYFLKTPQGY